MGRLPLVARMIRPSLIIAHWIQDRSELIALRNGRHTADEPDVNQARRDIELYLTPKTQVPEVIEP
jgi:hypothetical protein